VPRGGIARHAAAPLCCVLAAAALTACGATTTRPASDAAPRGTAAASGPAAATPPAASAPAAPAVRTPATAARGAAPAARGTAAAGATTAPPTDPPLPSGLPSSAPLRVRLAAACVTPGGEQSVVVETLPEAYVAFDNLYPDGRTGAAYGGNEASGRTGADGRFTAVWRVAPGTPEGRVRVDVGVSAKDGSAITMAYYQLATRC
jgi:hypothetical protein